MTDWTTSLVHAWSPRILQVVLRYLGVILAWIAAKSGLDLTTLQTDAVQPLALGISAIICFALDHLLHYLQKRWSDKIPVSLRL